MTNRNPTWLIRGFLIAGFKLFQGPRAKKILGPLGGPS